MRPDVVPGLKNCDDVSGDRAADQKPGMTVRQPEAVELTDSISRQRGQELHYV